MLLRSSARRSAKRADSSISRAGSPSASKHAACATLQPRLNACSSLYAILSPLPNPRAYATRVTLRSDTALESLDIVLASFVSGYVGLQGVVFRKFESYGPDRTLKFLGLSVGPRRLREQARKVRSERGQSFGHGIGARYRA